MRTRYREMDMKRLFTYIALTAALAFGGNALAQDKPATPAADAKPAAAAPAETAKPAAAAAAPAAAPAADAKPAEAPKPKVDKGDTAWMLMATVLVILMTIPGLALFYAGITGT